MAVVGDLFGEGGADAGAHGRGDRIEESTGAAREQGAVHGPVLGAAELVGLFRLEETKEGSVAVVSLQFGERERAPQVGVEAPPGMATWLVEQGDGLEGRQAREAQIVERDELAAPADGRRRARAFEVITDAEAAEGEAEHGGARRVRDSVLGEDRRELCVLTLYRDEGELPSARDAAADLGRARALMTRHRAGRGPVVPEVRESVERVLPSREGVWIAEVAEVVAQEDLPGEAERDGGVALPAEREDGAGALEAGR